MFLIIIIVAAVIIAVGLVILLFRRSVQNSDSNNSQEKNRDSIIKNANKKLEKNPKDLSAIFDLANLYYSEEDYKKSGNLFNLLLNQGAKNQDISEFEIAYKYAVCALKTDNINDAYKYFIYARSINKDVFEVEYNLGIIEFDKKNYEKALSLFQQAKQLLPDHLPTIQYIGKIFFQINRFSDAIQYLKKIELFSLGDKETFFLLAQCYRETGQIENSFRIFQHLRPHPVYGATACLETGKVYMQKNSFEAAIADFELGLKHKDTKPEVILDLLYSLSQTYIETNKIQKALNIFEKILSINPQYKDIKTLKTKYTGFASNKNLNTYVLASVSDFVNLCRRIVPLFYPNASIKITDIAATKNEYIDITSEIILHQMEDIVLFRFIRATTSVGDFLLRDLYFKSKDIKAGQSICLSAGTFTEGAIQFAEGRTIDLIDEKKLNHLLERI